jgi:phosphatidylinositol alpha-mannosyltransferase
VRIALVCPYDWSKPGGVREHVESLAGLLGAEHDVRVFAPVTGAPPPGVEPVGRAVGVPYNRSVAPVALSPLAGRRAVRALRAYEPDLVHVHEPVAPLVSLAASLRGPRPVVGTFHIWSDRDRAYRLAAPLARRVVAGLAARVAVSLAARDYVAGAVGLDPATFRVVPNGVDVDRFATAEPLRELADPERPLLLFVGRLEPRKGLDVAVRAFLRLRRSVPGVRLCVVGDGPERARCQALIPPEVRPDALFVGRVSHEDLPRYHASAQVFLAPATTGESFGIVLLEAMAAGLPVVASDIPGYRSVMSDRVQGLMVPPMNAFALADVASALLADPASRDAMAAEGRRTAARYAWPVIVAQLLEVYRAAVTYTAGDNAREHRSGTEGER